VLLISVLFDPAVFVEKELIFWNFAHFVVFASIGFVKH